MCGIFGYVGNKNTAANLVLEGLKHLEYRGYDSWGVAVGAMGNGKWEMANGKKQVGTKINAKGDDNRLTIVVKKKTGKIGDGTVTELPKSDIGFGHTRWATHGGVTDENAHPHLDCTQKYAVIHNGIIENYDELKKMLVKKGHTFVSETDSEVAVHLVEEYTKTMLLPKAVQKAFLELEGLNAIIVFSVTDHKFIAARNGSPLVIGFGDHENFIASDASALLPHTKQVHYLEDKQMAIISEKGVMIFEADTGEYIHPKKQKLTWTISQAEKGNYRDFMNKEIHEQPGILSDIVTNNAEHIKKLAGLIKKYDDIYLIGCGTAGHAALAGTYFLGSIAKKRVSWAVASEFGYHVDALSKKSLIIALSQSGETMDTLEAVKMAKARGATIASMVNVMGSTLYRQSDLKILLSAGPEKSVASTKAMISKLGHLLMLAHAVAGHPKQGVEAVLAAAKASAKILESTHTKTIETLAHKISDKTDMYIIGRGFSYPASLEAALKIKEISYMHAEGFASGELKHGVLALVEKGTPCMAYIPSDKSLGANLAGAMEMKARGGFIIGVSDKKHDVFDVHIPVPYVDEATIIPNIIVGQLLAYYLTLERKLDPDKPRNLAKSVTVK